MSKNSSLNHDINFYFVTIMINCKGKLFIPIEFFISRLETVISVKNNYLCSILSFIVFNVLKIDNLELY